MDKDQLLSICIPTYNRADCLDQVLSKMLPICMQEQIHICISDNASPDSTQEVVCKYEKKYPIIHYHRHTSNIGSDDNFEYVLKMPNTRYRWLMSDTCYIDSIDSVLHDLTEGDYDGYILNGGDGTRHMLLPKQKTYYTDSRLLMRDIGWHLTWISCMIYNERLINKLDFKRYKNSSFNQTALMFDPTASQECKICFNPNLTVKNLIINKESGWQYHVFDVMYKQWYLLVMSLPLYYPYEIKMKCIRDNANKAALLSKFFHIKRRSEGKWSIMDVYKNRFFIRQSDGGYFFLLFIGICPKFLLKAIVQPLSSLISYLKENQRTGNIIRKIYGVYVKVTH